LRVGDSLLGGQGGTIGPRCVKVLLAQCVTHTCNRGRVAGFVYLEADGAHALAHRVRRAEHPGRFTMIAGLGRQSGDAPDDVRQWLVRPSGGCAVSADAKCQPVVEDTVSSTRRRASTTSPRASAISARGLRFNAAAHVRGPADMLESRFGPPVGPAGWQPRPVAA
jgi:hypothetical protein